MTTGAITKEHLLKVLMEIVKTMARRVESLHMKGIYIATCLHWSGGYENWADGAKKDN